MSKIRGPKLLPALFHRRESEVQHRKHLAHLNSTPEELLRLAKEKIRSAVRTDFILSAEIIVIILGTVARRLIALQN